MRGIAGNSWNGTSSSPKGLSRGKFFRLCGWIFLLGACALGPDPAEFKARMTKEELVARFGEPERRATLVKRMEHMHGPIEGLWYNLDISTRVEIWAYRVQGGSVELYFLQGGQVAAATAFAPEGAVY